MQKFSKNLKSKISRSKKQNQSRHCPLTFTASALLLLASCQSFQSRSLNLPAHAQKWKASDISREKVQTFAKQLGASPTVTSAYNPADGISLNEGKVIALIYNPDLRVARLKAGVAKASAKNAGLWTDPDLGIDVLKITEGVPSPWIIGSSLSLTIPISGRLNAEKKRAKADEIAHLARVAEREWAITNDLQKAWISWTAQKTRLQQTEKIVSSLESVVKSTGQLVELGEMPKTEAALFTIEQKSRRAEIAHLRGEVDAEEQEIRSLLGLSPKAPIQLVPSLTIPNVPTDEARLAENNPTLQRLRLEYEVAEFTLLREIRAQFPDLTIGPQAEKDEGQSRIGLIGGIPLPILNANKGGIAKARAEREVAQAAFETEFERKSGKLAASSARLKALRAQRSAIENDLLPAVDRQVQDAENLILLGESSSLVFLESLIRAHEAKLKIIDIHQQESQIKTEIHLLTGP